MKAATKSLFMIYLICPQSDRRPPETGRMQGAAARRSGATARSRNAASDWFAELPRGFERKGRIAALRRLLRGPP
jgi:hypothetical protein